MNLKISSLFLTIFTKVIENKKNLSMYECKYVQLYDIAYIIEPSTKSSSIR